jgi:hypothetical protein
MKTKLGLIVLVAAALMSCGNRNAKNVEGMETIEDAVVSEVPEVIDNVVNLISYKDSTIKGYLMFAEDSSTVEISLPEETVVLERRTNGNGDSVWNVEDDDTYHLQKKDNKWVVSRREVILYISE